MVWKCRPAVSICVIALAKGYRTYLAMPSDYRLAAYCFQHCMYIFMYVKMLSTRGLEKKVIPNTYCIRLYVLGTIVLRTMYPMNYGFFYIGAGYAYYIICFISVIAMHWRKSFREVIKFHKTKFHEKFHEIFDDMS
jgi:hypothetical protein